jgi:hypothetical protein
MRTDGWTNITKLRVVSGNFANAPKKQHVSRVMCLDAALLLILVGFRLLCFFRQQTHYEMCKIHTVLQCI